MPKRFLRSLPVIAAAAWFFCLVPAVFAAAPSIGTVSPVSVNAGTQTTFMASVSSVNVIASCDLFVDENDVGVMTVNGNTASLTYTYSTYGVHTMFVFCTDHASDSAAGPNTSVFVQGGTVGAGEPFGGSTPVSPQTPAQATSTQTVPPVPPDGSLVKLECGADAGADDPCTAVYYVGKDGARHAFPNSKVYFSWYADFNSVQTVTPDVMDSFSLGKNVTYRPGYKLVKFTTDPKTYAVSKGGQLQWVTSEDVAIGLYGTDWNTKVDDIPDTFFGDYTLSNDISDAANYSATTELNSVPTIDDNL